MYFIISCRIDTCFLQRLVRIMSVCFRNKVFTEGERNVHPKLPIKAELMHVPLFFKPSFSETALLVRHLLKSFDNLDN